MFIGTLNAKSFSKDQNIQQIKSNDMRSVEDLPNSNELPTEYEEFKHLRHRRTVVFRPLFVYRQEQIEKQRINEESNRRNDHHKHRHIDRGHTQHKQNSHENTNNCCHGY